MALNPEPTSFDHPLRRLRDLRRMALESESIQLHAGPQMPPQQPLAILKTSKILFIECQANLGKTRIFKDQHQLDQISMFNTPIQLQINYSAPRD